jgi:hypothetical protein
VFAYIESKYRFREVLLKFMPFLLHSSEYVNNSRYRWMGDKLNCTKIKVRTRLKSVNTYHCTTDNVLSSHILTNKKLNSVKMWYHLYFYVWEVAILQNAGWKTADDGVRYRVLWQNIVCMCTYHNFVLMPSSVCFSILNSLAMWYLNWIF